MSTTDQQPPPRVSIDAQIAAMGLVCDRQMAIAGGRAVKSKAPLAQEAEHLRHLQAIGRTLRWLRDNEAAVRAFVESRREGAAS